MVSDIGFEPMTFSMSRRRAYQLRQSESKWSFPGDSNAEPSPCEGAALTIGRGKVGLTSGIRTQDIWNHNPPFYQTELMPTSNGGATASRSQMCFTTLAFQASPFANSGIAPLKLLAELGGFEPPQDLSTPTGELATRCLA